VESAGGVRLFDACMRDLSPAGPRDAVILALGLAAGLRRAEIAGLSLADLDVAGEVVRVVGKGRKAREVPVKGGTLEAIRAWLRCRGGEPGPLSVPFGRAAGWSCGRSRLRQSCGSVRNEGRKRGCGSSRRTTCVAPKSACC